MIDDELGCSFALSSFATHMKFFSAIATFAGLLAVAEAFSSSSSFLSSSRSMAPVAEGSTRTANRPGMTMRARICDLTGKRPNRQAMSVTFSHKRTKKVQGVNLQKKRLWWTEGNKFVTMRISTKVTEKGSNGLLAVIALTRC